MIKVTIPGTLPGLNEIIEESKKGKGNWQPYNDMKRLHTETIAWIVKSTIKRDLGKINVNINWICPNRRKDKDNIQAGTKFILDGLVEGGAIENDGWEQIGKLNHDFSVDKKNPRIELLIEEV